LKFGQWLGLIALLAALVLLWNLRGSLVLLFTAVVLAMALCTLVGAVRERLNCPRPLALVASLVGVVVIASVVSTAVIPPFVEQFSELIQKLPRAAELLLNWFTTPCFPPRGCCTAPVTVAWSG
jgi:predicted PurR-regulated permease PerM